jgi:hypothetical protein
MATLVIKVNSELDKDCGSTSNFQRSTALGVHAKPRAM